MNNDGQEDMEDDGANAMDDAQLDFEQIDMKICGDLSK